MWMRIRRLCKCMNQIGKLAARSWNGAISIAVYLVVV